MAACSRRSLTSSFVHITRRFSPSYAHLLPRPDRDGDGDGHLPPTTSPSRTYVAHPSTSSCRPFPGSAARSTAVAGDRRAQWSSFPLGLEASHRWYSSTSGGSDDAEYLKDMADVFTEKGVDVAAAAAAQAAPVAGEVALAAADSALPVAALQHLIDAVHSFTGLNWWAAIALTTLLMRTATVPLLINGMRASTKLNLMRPHLEELKEQMQNSADPQAVQESHKRMKELFREHGVTPFTPLKGLFIQGPIFISFYLAITNMVEKVPSFKEGGAFWFPDLTTPDPLYMLPILTSLSFLATVELNMQEGMEGNPIASTMKNFSRILAFLTVPFTATFPKAIFCYWVTSNLFSLTYGMVLKRPPVRKFLNLPEFVPQDATATRPSFPFFGGSKQMTPTVLPSSPMPPQQSQSPERRVSSSSVISQRIRNLERTVKNRNKPKKR
uniref:Mitochondrial inner membrane protein OXA1-like n=1 Tax=Anthurium amnicola TaxID=1678845 RepID=A0A1D1ZDJ3_9ARAE